MITLSTAQIRKLYGFKANEEAVAFGRSIKHTNPGTRKLKLEDFEVGSDEYNALYNRIHKSKSKAAAQVIESQVS
jgi:hypothetical protein